MATIYGTSSFRGYLPQDASFGGSNFGEGLLTATSCLPVFKKLLFDR